MSIFSTNFYQLRVDNGYTLDSLAKAINKSKGTNFTKSTFSKWEHGSTEPSFQNIVPIADFFNVSVDWLIGINDALESKYSHINTAAVADLMLEPSNKELIEIINEMNPSQKEELLHYAHYLKKRED